MSPPGVKLKFMGFGEFFLISGPGGVCGGFTPPPTHPPLPPPPPTPPGAASHIPTCKGVFAAGPGGSFPAGCIGSRFDIVAGARFSVDSVRVFTILFVCYLALRKRVQKSLRV